MPSTGPAAKRFCDTFGMTCVTRRLRPRATGTRPEGGRLCPERAWRRNGSSPKPLARNRLLPSLRNVPAMAPCGDRAGAPTRTFAVSALPVDLTAKRRLSGSHSQTGAPDAASCSLKYQFKNVTKDQSLVKESLSDLTDGPDLKTSGKSMLFRVIYLSDSSSGLPYQSDPV